MTTAKMAGALGAGHKTHTDPPAFFAHITVLFSFRLRHFSSPSMTSPPMNVRAQKYKDSRLTGAANFPASLTEYRTHGRRTRTGYSRIRPSVRHPGCPCRHNPGIGLRAAPRPEDFHIVCPANKNPVHHRAATVGKPYSRLGGQCNDAPHNPEWPHG